MVSNGKIDSDGPRHCLRGVPCPDYLWRRPDFTMSLETYSTFESQHDRALDTCELDPSMTLSTSRQWPGERHPTRWDVHDANESPAATFLDQFRAALLHSEGAENDVLLDNDPEIGASQEADLVPSHPKLADRIVLTEPHSMMSSSTHIRWCYFLKSPQPRLRRSWHICRACSRPLSKNTSSWTLWTMCRPLPARRLRISTSHPRAWDQ